MGKWAHSINIKQHLADETTNAAIFAAATGVVQELNKLPSKWLDIGSADYDPELEEHIEWFMDYAEEAKRENPDEENDDLTDEFNYRLSDLYDWANSKRVWLGLL